MSRSSEAFARLTTALINTVPPCSGDSRFTDDDQAALELAPICRRCPLFDACSEYALLERPTAGIWAGVRYRTNQPRKAKK